jgi:CheY-like chemotaxis protein
MIHVPTNILLVDDEKDFVEMLSMRLEDAGDKVTPAYDGSMCLEKAQRDTHRCGHPRYKNARNGWNSGIKGD